jgi:RNA polymerase sigma-70 factor (ECF subfamily)
MTTLLVGKSQRTVIAVVDFPALTRCNNTMVPVTTAVDAGLLFEAHHDRIYRYLLRLVRNPAEAEDLTQETFLRAYRRGDSLRDPEAVRGWLYRIATHVCLDRLRQRKSHPAVQADEVTGQLPPAVSASPSMLEVVERKETSACVQRCLDFLPDHYRAVILLHEAHGLTAPEIANFLGISLFTVKIRLHRARHKLQQVMEQGCAVSSDSQGVPACHPKS